MKKIVFIAFILIATACSTTKTVTTDMVDKNKTLAIPEGKAIVYFVRPSMVGTIVPFKVSCNDSLIGSTTGKKYLFVVLDPNTYKFISEAENDAELELQVEPDSKYYIEQKPKMGLIMARNELSLLDNAEGEQKLAKCSISSKFSPPEF
ncbi:MAG: DUF2846 domain-containing protein [Draconibacterium sp.]|nr:DUF2846 domain-containing protein [Draconibacterium sp.]